MKSVFRAGALADGVQHAAARAADAARDAGSFVAGTVGQGSHAGAAWVAGAGRAGGGVLRDVAGVGLRAGGGAVGGLKGAAGNVAGTVVQVPSSPFGPYRHVLSNHTPCIDASSVWPDVRRWMIDSGRGSTSAEDARGTLYTSHISPNI